MPSIPCPCCDGSAQLDLDTIEGLRRLRVMLGMTGKDMAQRLRLQPATFSNYEHGRLTGTRSKFAERYRRVLLAEFRSGLSS